MIDHHNVNAPPLPPAPEDPSQDGPTLRRRQRNVHAGWTPHEGGACPVGPDAIVHLLLRGTPKRGPRESGPSPASAVEWEYSVSIARMEGPKPSIADQLLGRAAHDPSGDIIGWRLFDTPGYFERFPHVRADIGVGR